jgi:hypothetical protein
VTALDLFSTIGVVVVPDHEPDATIQERFEAFHAANPAVYERLCDLARSLVRKGHQRVGIGVLWETLRYTELSTRDAGSEFKLNDHYRSRYARLIADNEPDLADVFELRKLRAA